MLLLQQPSYRCNNTSAMSYGESPLKHTIASQQSHRKEYSAMLRIVKPAFWFLVSIFGIYWLILVSTLREMESFRPSVPSIMASTSAQDLPHVKDIRKLLGCDEANWDECLLAASKSANNQALHRLQEITELLGCDEENWDECLLAASKFAKIQAVYAQQIATHRKEALQRALDGPTEYLKIKVFPEKHPVLVPLLPRYQPRPKWNVSLGIADVNIAFVLSRRIESNLSLTRVSDS
jgi:hypothetical protein